MPGEAFPETSSEGSHISVWDSRTQRLMELAGIGKVVQDVAKTSRSKDGR